MAHTTTPQPSADQIDTLWIAANTTWPVTYSLETAHQAVAIVKGLDMASFSLAVHTGGRWELVRAASSVTEALGLVPAVVAAYLTTGVQA